MTDNELTSHNDMKVAELYPWLRMKAQAILKDLRGHGHRPRIQCAWRSVADQLEAYKHGYSKVKYGFHNCTGPNGRPEALALDIISDSHPYDEKQHAPTFLTHLRSSAQAHGLDAPISWDPWHVQVVGISIAAARRGKRPGN